MNGTAAGRRQPATGNRPSAVPYFPARPTLSGRDWIRLSTLTWAAAAAPLRAQATPLKMLLNSGYSGANAFFLLAQDKGYFKDAGVDVTFTPGVGAYTAAERMIKEG